MAENVASLIDEILTKLHLDTTTPVAIERNTVLQEINNCLKDLSRTCGMFVEVDDSTIELVSGTASYTLPSDLAEIARITDEDNERVYPTTTLELDNYKIDWPDDTGRPRYYVRGYDGYDKITLYKCPSDDYDGKVLTLRYKKYTGAVEDSASSTLPAPISNERGLILNWCLGQLLLAQSEVADINKGRQYLTLYYQERKAWETIDLISDRMYIYGIAGKRRPRSGGPRLPDNYPRWRW